MLQQVSNQLRIHSVCFIWATVKYYTSWHQKFPGKRLVLSPKWPLCYTFLDLYSLRNRNSIYNRYHPKDLAMPITNMCDCLIVDTWVPYLSQTTGPYHCPNSLVWLQILLSNETSLESGPYEVALTAGRMKPVSLTLTNPSSPALANFSSPGTVTSLTMPLSCSCRWDINTP